MAFWNRGTSTSRDIFSRSLMMTISQTTTTVSASRTLRCFDTFFACVHDELFMWFSYYGKHQVVLWQLGQVSGVHLIENLTAIWAMLQIRVDKISRHKSHSGSLAFTFCISMLLESKAPGFMSVSIGYLNLQADCFPTTLIIETCLGNYLEMLGAKAFWRHSCTVCCQLS